MRQGKAENSSFLPYQTGSCCGHGDTLRRKHFAANTAGRVGCNHQIGIGADLLGSRSLQRREQGIGRSVRTSQEHAQPAKDWRKEREQASGLRKGQTMVALMPE